MSGGQGRTPLDTAEPVFATPASRLLRAAR